MATARRGKHWAMVQPTDRRGTALLQFGQELATVCGIDEASPKAEALQGRDLCRRIGGIAVLLAHLAVGIIRSAHAMEASEHGARRRQALPPPLAAGVVTLRKE
jgi:hypothetical protein